MQDHKMRELAEWVNFLSQVDIPVLKQTARNLSALRQNEKNLSARSVAYVIRHDPMMTVKLLRHLQQKKHRSQEHELVEVDQALMMLGLDIFFKKVPAEPLAETVLSGRMDALSCLLRVMHRSNRASTFAVDWAVRLNDMHHEEVRIAALLFDIAELLMWCFAPEDMLKIRAMQQQNKTLRSNDAQERVLGFTLLHLQSALALKWSLPKLLIALMDGECANQQRVRNVLLAVNLARHSANGWADAALPDDYIDIGKLLHMPPEEVKVMIGAEEKGL
ncbi:HDOD domain-containing protein [Candidatus Nitrotoga sp. BS]|uniref:HDOD domain-containing protein n=1 Tax=Candidatus Nitrotoga sp. BS TaxID=2890408 RepID=UPI001EF1CB58|nr:HDOD domain-containing protein [Candidatus Nitrotoga sp. BS]CAH1190646.1 HDOD domain-containing protein [Candidatus Nitrotoga sp. BS]